MAKRVGTGRDYNRATHGRPRDVVADQAPKAVTGRIIFTPCGITFQNGESLQLVNCARSNGGRKCQLPRKPPLWQRLCVAVAR